MTESEREIADGEIFTLSEIARYLKVGERRVLKMVHERAIPAIRIGNQWRFVAAMVNDWLNTGAQKIRPHNELTRLIELNDPSVPLSRLIVPRYITLDLQPGTAAEVLTQLTNPFLIANLIDFDKQKHLVEDLLYREKIMSTAVEDGVAFPHSRTPSDNPISGPLIHIGRCDSGTDFGSPNRKPTYLFFLICTNSISVHLRVTARLAQAVSDASLLSRILNAKTGEATLAAFLDMRI